MYQFREDIDINSLIDGRTILYLAKSLHFNRDNLSKILKNGKPCSYSGAKMLVDYCKPNDTVEMYFTKIEKEG